jgi:glycosyltransferase involved in cell wall biosynthesis
MRIAVVASHPIQYYTPVFRELAQRFDLKVFFAHRATQDDQAKAGFGIGFDWDIDLLSGYEHAFLRNVAIQPGLDHFAGCDTPEIGTKLDEGHFDAVLVHGWHLKSFVQTILAAKWRGLPLLTRGDSHLETPRSKLKKSAKAIVYPAFLRLFDAALYVGKRSRAYWTHYHYPRTRLFFSPHCIDSEWFAARATVNSRHVLRARLGIPPDANVALFAGKLVPFKRPLDVIAAAALMKTAGHEIVVLVAGAGPVESEMAMAARAAGVTLHLLGFCNQTEMPAVYAASDVLVLASDGCETWGLVANEALACGRPIVLSHTVGAAPDLAEDEIAGRVFPLGDVVALANALRDVTAHPPSLQMIAKKSKTYSIASAINGIEAAIIKTVSAKTRGERFWRSSKL